MGIDEDQIDKDDSPEAGGKERVADTDVRRSIIMLLAATFFYYMSLWELQHSRIIVYTHRSTPPNATPINKKTPYNMGEKPGASQRSAGHKTMMTAVPRATFLRPILSERFARGP